MQHDGRGSTRSWERDPAEGGQENPRGDEQERTSGRHDVRRRCYLPPRLVTSYCTFSHTHLLFVSVNVNALKQEKHQNNRGSLTRTPTLTSMLFSKGFAAAAGSS